MFLLGGIAALVMIVILLVLFDVRWRLLPLGVIVIGLIWAFGMAGYLHIPLTLATIAGLPVMLGVGIDYAIQMQARVEEEVVAQQGRAPDPGDRPQPVPGPAGGDLRRRVRLLGALLRQGADDPPVRRPAGGRHRHDLPVLASWLPLAALGIREYKSPTVRQPSKRSEALGRLVEKMGGLPKPLGGAADRAQPARLLRRHPGRGQAHPADRPGPVGQPALPGHPQHPRARARAPARPTSWACSCRPRTCSPTTWSRSVDLFTTAQLKINADKLVIGHQHRGRRSATSSTTCPGANHVVPTGTEVHDAYLVAPHDLQSSSATARRPGHEHRVPHRHPRAHQPGPRQAGRAGQDHARSAQAAGRDHGDQGRQLPRRPAGRGHRHAVGAGRGRRRACSTTWSPTGCCSPTWPSSSWPLFLAVRLRSLVRSLLSLVPVLIAVGAASLVAYVLAPQAEPAHRRGRSAGGGRVHRVHLADPAALRRGARQGPSPRRRPSTARPRAPAGPSSCRA